MVGGSLEVGVGVDRANTHPLLHPGPRRRHQRRGTATPAIDSAELPKNWGRTLQSIHAEVGPGGHSSMWVWGAIFVEVYQKTMSGPRKVVGIGTKRSREPVRSTRRRRSIRGYGDKRVCRVPSIRRPGVSQISVCPQTESNPWLGIYLWIYLWLGRYLLSRFKTRISFEFLICVNHIFLRLEAVSQIVVVLRNLRQYG